MNKDQLPHCQDCRAVAPKTDADYTLSTVGWRCVVELDPAGSKKAVWRCASCWSQRRQDKTSPGFRVKSTVRNSR